MKIVYGCVSWTFRCKNLFCGGFFSQHLKKHCNSVENIFERHQCTFHEDICRCFYTTPKPNYFDILLFREIKKRKTVRFPRGFRKEIFVFFPYFFTFVNSIVIGSTRSYILYNYYLFACFKREVFFILRNIYIHTDAPYGTLQTLYAHAVFTRFE